MIEQPSRREQTSTELLERAFLRPFPTRLARIAEDIQIELTQRGCATLGDLVAKVRQKELPAEDLDFFEKNLGLYTDERAHRDEWAKELFDEHGQHRTRINGYFFGGRVEEALREIDDQMIELSERQQQAESLPEVEKLSERQEIDKEKQRLRVYKDVLSDAQISSVQDLCLEYFDAMEIIGIGRMVPDPSVRLDCLRYAWANAILAPLGDMVRMTSVPDALPFDRLQLQADMEVQHRSILFEENAHFFDQHASLFRRCLEFFPHVQRGPRQEEFMTLLSMIDPEEFWKSYLDGSFLFPWEQPGRVQAHLQNPHVIANLWKRVSKGLPAPNVAIEKLFQFTEMIPDREKRLNTEAQIIGLSGAGELWPSAQAQGPTSRYSLEVSYRHGLQEFTWRDLARRAMPIVAVS